MKTKKNIKKVLITCIIMCFSYTSTVIAQNVGINVTGADPNEKALLDIDATNSEAKGLLIPRITKEERDSIEAPIPDGLLVFNTTSMCFEAWNGYWWYRFGCIKLLGDPPVIQETEVVEVMSGTGEIWMDRNLGASRAAMWEGDTMAYGGLFQWGRENDGHAYRYSTVGQVAGDGSPHLGHPYFLPSGPGSHGLWYSGTDPDRELLWTGVNAVNNPCPAGFRVPTIMELNAERQSWGEQNSSGAFNNSRRWVCAGARNGSTTSTTYIPGIFNKSFHNTLYGYYNISSWLCGNHYYYCPWGFGAYHSSNRNQFLIFNCQAASTPLGGVKRTPSEDEEHCPIETQTTSGYGISFEVGIIG